MSRTLYIELSQMKSSASESIKNDGLFQFGTAQSRETRSLKTKTSKLCWPFNSERRILCWGLYRPPSSNMLLSSPCTAFSQSLSVNSFQWRIRDERAGNTFSHGPRDLKHFGREEKWGLGTRQDMRPKSEISPRKQSLIFEHHKGRILFYLFFFLHWHLTYSATLSFIKFYCQRNSYYLFVFSMIKPIITKTINS